jgi:hypothetical protein
MNCLRPWMFAGPALIAVGASLLCHQGCVREAPPPAPRAEAQPAAQPAPQPLAAAPAWQELFDGRSLDGWKAPQFGGEGKVHVRDGMIVMEAGALMTGIVWTGQPPRDNYELQLEGMRLSGSDFFATVTFPVGKEHCSFVVGGWGGSLIGLSNVDYADASENATSDTFAFADNRWYRIRVRVSPAAIEVWIDDKQVVKQPRAEHVFGIRPEVELCCPLGISTWCTAGAVRNIRIRRLEESK